MSERVRVRFAPSPTGLLHIGGARTALFNWLFAKHNQGSFVLRIEDTDRERSTDENIGAILDGLRWLGLSWDEGPFRQTDRFDIYKKYIDKLLIAGKAFYCYCSPEELEAARKLSMKQGRALKYNGKCRDLKQKPVVTNSNSDKKRKVVRFKMPQEGETVIRDLVKGSVSFDNAQLDDLIIQRSDGTPTYNLTVVVDDVDMGITHVIRGDDHLNNTPRQVQIYEALGYPVPAYAHLPMILGPDRTRLSKRHGATSVTAYRDAGILPEALINYLARLGWSYGNQEIFTKEELVSYFTLESVGEAAAVFDPDKLAWINAQYLIHTPEERLVDMVMPYLIQKKIIGEQDVLDRIWLVRAVRMLKERSRSLAELADSLSLYITEDIGYNEKAKKKFLNMESLVFLRQLRVKLERAQNFSVSELESIFSSIVREHNIKLGKLAQPVRVAVTGGTASPGIFDVIEVLGKEKTLKRLAKAIDTIEVS